MKLRVVSWLVCAVLAAFAWACTGLRDDDAAGMTREDREDAGGQDAAAGTGARDGGGAAGSLVGSGGNADAGSVEHATDGGRDAGDEPADAAADVAPPCTGDECAACKAEPCLHGGACAPVSGGRKCTCVPPWFGASCENNDDAALSALAVTAGTLWPAFDPEITEYTVDLGFADGRIAVIPTVRVPEGASLRVEGVALESGATSAEKSLAINTSDGFSIVVASNTDARLTYTVTVRRSFVQRAYVKLNADQTGAEMGIGNAVAMDSVRMVYGLPGAKYIDIENAGAVDTLLRRRGSFDPGQTISPPMPQAGARFGMVLALAGDYLAVSAPSEDDGPNADVGAVYVFEQGSSGWKSVARFTQGAEAQSLNFGAALALGGDVLVIGAPGQRRAYPYRRIGGVWTPQAALESSTDSFFGTRVATDGTWIAVGGDGPAVELYRYTPGSAGNAWIHEGTLQPDTAAENNFGSGLVFHDDVLAVGSSYACFGGCNGLASVYTFARNGTVWNKIGRIEAQRPPQVTANAAPGFFGVVIDFDGRTVVTSAPAEPLVAHGVYPSVPNGVSDGAAAVGAGYVYDASGRDLELTAYLKASNGESGDNFGSAVAVADGLIAIGAFGEDSGAGRVRAVAADDNAALEAGAIYVFGADCSLLPNGAIVPGC